MPEEIYYSPTILADYFDCGEVTDQEHPEISLEAIGQVASDGTVYWRAVK